MRLRKCSTFTDVTELNRCISDSQVIWSLVFHQVTSIFGLVWLLVLCWTQRLVHKWRTFRGNLCFLFPLVSSYSQANIFCSGVNSIVDNCFLLFTESTILLVIAIGESHCFLEMSIKFYGMLPQKYSIQWVDLDESIYFLAKNFFISVNFIFKLDNSYCEPPLKPNFSKEEMICGLPRI